jgi:hypothetical protein
MHTTRIRFTAATLILGMATAFTAAAALAETATTETIPSHPSLNDRFVFEFGGYYSRSSTQAGLSGSGGGIGVTVDFENTLGLDDRNLTPITGFLWRMTERWRLEVEYFRLDRDANRTLASDVTWGDQTFTAGTSVNSVYNFYDARVSAGYSFFKRRDKELGIGLGLHVAGVKASLQAAGVGSEAADVLAPLPVLNLYGSFALTDEWAVRMRMDWFSLASGNFSGDIRNTAIDVLYQPFRHVGFGLGIRNLVLDVKIDDPDWTGRARTVFTGPAAFMTVSF